MLADAGAPVLLTRAALIWSIAASTACNSSSPMPAAV
jgi:hypothetical protein